MKIKRSLLNLGLFALLLSMSFAVYSIQNNESSNEEVIAEVGPYLEDLDPAFVAEVLAIEKVIDITDMEKIETGGEASQMFDACIYTLVGVTRLIPPPFPVWLTSGGEICYAPAAPGTPCIAPVPGQGPYRIVWNNTTIGVAQDVSSNSSSNQPCPNTAGRRVLVF
jgi:hypothetical protein